MEVEKSVRRIDMCHGPIFINVIRYTVPIICTSVLQLLFNAADLVVVGRYCGINSVAAVGATNSLIHLFVNLFIGLGAGVSVAVAYAVGERDESKISRVVHTAIPLAVICGMIITTIGFTFSKPLLLLMGTPDETLPLSSLYIKIYFCGMVPSLVYEFSAAVCRASGDTKTPLKFLSLSGIINVVLNVFFVTIIDLNVVGVAIATVIAQIVSCVLMVIFLCRRNDCFKLQISKIRIYRQELIRIIKIGLPTGIQTSVFSASNVIIQSSVNSFGAAAIAGNTAAASIEGFIFVAMQAFHQSSLNYTGQNFGAKNSKRILKAFWTNIICVTVMSVTIIGVVYTFKTNLLSLYITDSPASIDVGVKRMSFICLFYFMCGIYEVLNGLIRGLGRSLVTMFISISGACGVRLVWIFTIFKTYHTLDSLYISYPISWGACIAALIVAAIIIFKKTKKLLDDGISNN